MGSPVRGGDLFPFSRAVGNTTGFPRGAEERGLRGGKTPLSPGERGGKNVSLQGGESVPKPEGAAVRKFFRISLGRVPGPPPWSFWGPRFPPGVFSPRGVLPGAFL